MRRATALPEIFTLYNFKGSSCNSRLHGPEHLDRRGLQLLNARRFGA